MKMPEPQKFFIDLTPFRASKFVTDHQTTWSLDCPYQNKPSGIHVYILYLSFENIVARRESGGEHLLDFLGHSDFLDIDTGWSSAEEWLCKGYPEGLVLELDLSMCLTMHKI